MFLEWLAYDNAVKVALKNLHVSEPFTFDSPAQFAQEDSVIFICVDVEAYERNHARITELGFAFLDTADLNGLAPGKNGHSWIDAIRCKHFRISENKHLINKAFILGCPDQFQFGESEFISIRNAPQIIASCFKPPYFNPNGSVDDAKRNIILVGHDLPSDVDYLRKIGYDVTNLPNLRENIDTSSMYRALRRETNPRNLGSCLADLSLTGWWLHNAGNDAAYTMQAMVAIALRDMAEREVADVKEKKEGVKKERLLEKVKDAVKTSLEQQQGWSSVEDDDGGEVPGQTLAPTPAPATWADEFSDWGPNNAAVSSPVEGLEGLKI